MRVATRVVQLSSVVILSVFVVYNLSKFPCYFDFSPMTDVTYNKTACENPSLHPYIGRYRRYVGEAEAEAVMQNVSFRAVGCSGMMMDWNLYVMFGRQSPLKLRSDVDNFLLPHCVMGVVIEILLILALLQGRRGLFDRSKFFFPLVAAFAIHILPEAEGIPNSLAGGAPINETICGLLLLFVAVGAAGMFKELGDDWSLPPEMTKGNGIMVTAWVVIGLLVNIGPLGNVLLLAAPQADNDGAGAFSRPHPASGHGFYSKWNCPWIGRIAAMGMLFSVFMYGFEIYAHARGEDWRSPFSRHGPALAQIAMEPAPGTDVELALRPETWLEATGECFVLCMVVSWLVTAVFNPDIFKVNILRNIVGYNNLCVGFDSAPARYFAMPLLVMQACCAARYSFLDTIRLKGTRHNLSNAQYYFAYIANWVFAVHMVCFPMLLVILADYMSWETTKIHLYLFMFTLFIMWMMIAGNVFEADDFPLDTKIWFFMFTAHTFLLPVVGVIDVNAFWGEYWWALTPEAPEVKRHLLKHMEPSPPVPWMITAYLDYGWFVLLLMTVLFLPKAPPVRTVFRCNLDDEDLETEPSLTSESCDTSSLGSDTIGKAW